jgi:hypothetical protein
MRDAVELDIFPCDVLIDESSWEESIAESDKADATSRHPISPTGKFVLYSMRDIQRKLDSIFGLAKINLMVSRGVRNDVKRVLKQQKEVQKEKGSGFRGGSLTIQGKNWPKVPISRKKEFRCM